MEPKDFFLQLREKKIKRNGIDTAHIEAVLEKRAQARKNKDFATSDALRKELEDKVIIVQDTPNGQMWDLP